MEGSVANENFKLLQTLEYHQKVMSDATGRMYVDDRILNGIRRTITGDSRDGMIGLLQQTFDKCSATNAEKLRLITKLGIVLQETYPDYAPLSTALAGCLHKFNFTEGRKPNAPLTASGAGGATVNANQVKLLHIRREGRLSDNVWQSLASDSWVSGALCDYILQHSDSFELFDIFLHQTGVKCRLSIFDPLKDERTFADVYSDTVKRIS